MIALIPSATSSPVSLGKLLTPIARTISRGCIFAQVPCMTRQRTCWVLSPEIPRFIHRYRAEPEAERRISGRVGQRPALSPDPLRDGIPEEDDVCAAEAVAAPVHLAEDSVPVESLRPPGPLAVLVPRDRHDRKVGLVPRRRQDKVDDRLRIGETVGMMADPRLSYHGDIAPRLKDLLFEHVGVLFDRHEFIRVAADVEHRESGAGDLRSQIDGIPPEHEGFLFGLQSEVSLESFPFLRASRALPFSSRPALEIKHRCVGIDACDARGVG